MVCAKINEKRKARIKKKTKTYEFLHRILKFFTSVEKKKETFTNFESIDPLIPVVSVSNGLKNVSSKMALQFGVRCVGRDYGEKFYNIDNFTDISATFIKIRIFEEM